MGHRVELFAESDIGEQDVLDLWARERALPPDVARRRLPELLHVAVDEASGELAAVSSAYVARNPQLRMDLWHFRAFVAGAHRRSGLALLLGVTGREHLEARHVSGADRRASGILWEVESEELKGVSPHGVWQRAGGFVFVGENDRGAWLRVRYFDDALVPELA